MTRGDFDDDVDNRRRIVEDPFEDPSAPRHAPRRPADAPEPVEEDRVVEQPPVVVPPDAISAEALEGLIEEFVTRHGTDLGEAGDKAAQVRRLLRSGKVQIVFDPNTESCNIVEA
jgi:hypothetical protein